MPDTTTTAFDWESFYAEAETQSNSDVDDTLYEVDELVGLS